VDLGWNLTILFATLSIKASLKSLKGV